MNIIVHTDGGARGNPGPAAVGAVIEIYQSDQCTNPANEKKQVIEISTAIGKTTNNVAEYTAVVEALKEINNNPIIKVSNKQIIRFYLDSNLVVNQLNGVFKIKDARLHSLYLSVLRGIDESGGRVTFSYVPREQNKHADMLVNKALDTLSKK